LPSTGAPDAEFIQSGNAVGIARPGEFLGGGRTVSPLAVSGDFVSVQVRGWSTAGQTASQLTYEQALILGTEVGKNAWFNMKTKHPDDAIPPPTLGFQAGWTGFAITPVPEPCVIAVGLIGVGAALMQRRCKRYWACQ